MWTVQEYFRIAPNCTRTVHRGIKNYKQIFTIIILDFFRAAQDGFGPFKFLLRQIV